MFRFIDNFLNNITMYRLVLYYVLVLLGIAEIFSFFHLLPFSPFALMVTTVFLVSICYLANKLLAAFFHVPTNVESVYISACILALIITPTSYALLFFAAVFTIASKFVLTINNKHIFNPVAFGIWLGALLTGQYASWWVGTASLMPFVLVGGLLIARKIRRENMVFAFFVVAGVTIFGFNIVNNVNLLVSLKKILLDTPILFFAFVMLTEPFTTPPTEMLRNVYAGIVGFLYAPQVHIANVYTTPELALLLGNIFSFIVSPKIRFVLQLAEKRKITDEIYHFIFQTKQKFSFIPGQYMEWTLQHSNTDSRGNRRYFTIASSPTEKNMSIGVRFNPSGSSYKKALSILDTQDIVATNIAGDFILPKDIKKKMVFVAGGIGVTPFRSMLKYLIDKKEKRDIVVLFSAKNNDEFVYKEIFDKAASELGIRVIYTITDKTAVPSNWEGYIGRITEDVIRKEIPDFTERTFYLSGPLGMITTYEKLLKGMRVNQIKKDYFPGFA